MHFFAQPDSNIRESFKVFKSNYYVNLHTAADNPSKVQAFAHLKLPCTLVLIGLKFDSSTDRQIVSSPVCRAHYATFSIVNTKSWVKTPPSYATAFASALSRRFAQHTIIFFLIEYRFFFYRCSVERPMRNSFQWSHYNRTSM